MEIKKLLLTVTGTLLLTGCADRTLKNDENTVVFERVKIDEAAGDKILYFSRNIFVGALGAHGWIESMTYEYNIAIPLGRLRNCMNPLVTGPDITGENYGYIIFDENKKEIKLRLYQVHYSPGSLYDPEHGGGLNSLPIIGDSEVPINGTYHVDNADAFK